MKTIRILLVALFILTTFSVYAQNEVTDEKIPVTWLGVNFTAASYIGAEDKFSANEFKHIHAAKINSIIQNEQKKFDLRAFLKKETIHIDTKAVSEANAQYDIPMFNVSENVSSEFTEKELPAIIKKLPIENKEGVGVMVVVKNLNKIDNLEIAHLVYFDMASKKIIYSKQLSGKAKGFGMAAFWANPVLDMLKTMEKEIVKMRKKK